MGMKGHSPCAVALLFLLATHAAARTPALRFSKTVDLPDLGLSVKIMPESQEVPLPPPTVFTYAFKDGDRAWTQEMYSPLELWRQSQHEGRWKDKHDNTLTLARISRPFPKGLGAKHVTREQYNEKAGQGGPPEPWTPEAMSQWAADYTGSSRAQSQIVSQHPVHLKNLVTFQLEGQPAVRMACAWRMNRAAAGQQRAPEDWFFILLDANPNADLEAARKAVIEQFFAGIEMSRGAPGSPASPSPTFQVPGISTNKETAEFAASRKQVADSIKNMKDWWFVETRNYIILSNLGGKYRVMVHDLQENIESLRSVYARLVPAAGEVTAVSVIRVFATPEEYMNYIDPRYKWSNGMWLGSKRELVVRPVDWGGSQEQRERLLSAIYHEAFHQYTFYALDKIDPSPWFNEGHAAFFENADVRKGYVTIGEDREKTRLLDKLIESNSVDLKGLLSMWYPDFYGTSDQVRNLNYALAWALIYYMHKGAPVDGLSRYASVPGRYVDALQKTKDPHKATAEAFKDIPLDVLNKDFVEFWKSRRQRVKALRFDPLGNPP